MYKKDRQIIWNMNMRRGMFMLMLLIGATLSAQNINVSSFKLLENDLTANTIGTMGRDQNGEVAALIKVVTTEQGFIFDGGMTGIVKSKQEIGEVWVYVPHGIKKVTIKHAQLGVLRDYFFPIPIEKAKTYEMVLTTGKVETFVTHAVNKQFVVFKVKPIDAIVELGNEVLTVDAEGYATKSMPYGTYDYRVSCANYHTAAGKVMVNAQGKAEVNVALRPNFGWIKFDAADEYHGAYVFIDNARVGQLPFVTGGIKSGTHRIKIVKSMYKTYEREVAVKDDETTEVAVELVPNFANITLIADENSEIWVDGERRGKGNWTGTLEMGDYTVEVKKESYRTTSELIRINSVGERTISLKSPTPIYGSLEISSAPLRATVYIDGKEVGETPLMMNDVLVGNRRVTFWKQGYLGVDKMVAVKENSENSVSAELTKVQNVVSENEQKDNNPQQVKQTKKKEPATNKERSWDLRCGIDAGYSTYAFNYGVETGIAKNRFSLYVGVKSHLVGSFVDYSEVRRSVQLMRFNTQLGYTFALGDFCIIPKVGVVYGPSFLKNGRFYVNSGLPYDSEDYFTLNHNIMQFASMRCGVITGVRLEYRFDFGLGIQVTPEYIIGEGVAVNAGLSMKF